MIDLQISSRELLLLNSALNPDPVSVTKSWERWSGEVRLEEAPYPELRMLPAVHAHLSRIAPRLELPQKLRGKARATFTRNQLLAHTSLPALVALSPTCPVMLIKGAAFCIQFSAWSSRAMGDIDIQIPRQELGRVCAILSSLDWSPKYGMTWASIQYRTALRRNSWGITKDRADIDIHWRFADGAAESRLEDALWSSARRVEFFGQNVLVPSAEFSCIASLRHGLLEGSRGDAFQTMLDTAAWLPLCDETTLAGLLTQADLWEAYRQVSETLSNVGLVGTFPKKLAAAHPGGKTVRHRPSSIPRGRQIESRLLRRPQLYRLWEVLGRKSRFERWLVRFGGPLSAPIASPTTAKEDYDLRDCAVIDEIGGPGWGWPEPEHTCFWSDRADSRLLIPLTGIDDYLIVLSLSSHRHSSPNPTVDVFANGHPIAILTLAGKKTAHADHTFMVPRRLLSGYWVELAFRPRRYLGDLNSSDQYALRRSLPASRIRILNARRLSDVFANEVLPLRSSRILRGEEPYTTRFSRIREKIVNSPFQRDARLPPDFNPVFYILLHDDLFDAEVDPYEHFIAFGRHERRTWGQGLPSVDNNEQSIALDRFKKGPG